MAGSRRQWQAVAGSGLAVAWQAVAWQADRNVQRETTDKQTSVMHALKHANNTDAYIL